MASFHTLVQAELLPVGCKVSAPTLCPGGFARHSHLPVEALESGVRVRSSANHAGAALATHHWDLEEGAVVAHNGCANDSLPALVSVQRRARLLGNPARIALNI